MMEEPPRAQEWNETFNPYTGQWESLNPPVSEQAGTQAEGRTGPTVLEERKPAKDVTQQAVPKAVPDTDYTSKEAALQILEHRDDEAAKWMYEQPLCPSMHYLKTLKGNDVCANPLGADVAVTCPAGTSLLTDHHPSGNDACRGRRSF